MLVNQSVCVSDNHADMLHGGKIQEEMLKPFSTSIPINRLNDQRSP